MKDGVPQTCRDRADDLIVHFTSIGASKVGLVQNKAVHIWRWLALWVTKWLGSSKNSSIFAWVIRTLSP